MLSAIGHSFQFFGEPGALHCDLCSDGIEFPEILRAEFDGNRPEILFQALQLRGAGNWNDPGFLRKEPRERDLSGCGIFLRGEGGHQIYESAISPTGLGREARETAAIVLWVKLRVFRNRPSEESLTKRTERNKPNAEFFERGNDFFFRPLPPERVFTLQRRHRLNCMCAAYGLCPRFRQSEVLHLAFLNQALHCSRHVFNGHVRIDEMLIEKIDGVDLEPCQRALDTLFDVLRAAVQTDWMRIFRGVNLESELCRDHHLLTQGSQSLAHKL